MTGSTFERVIVPVGNQEDAAATARALRPYLDEGQRNVVALHVIEKAGGALDKASVEQRERDAMAIFATLRDGLEGSAVELETTIRYGTDVAGTVIEAAHESGATAIVFTPRGGSRWAKLLTGDVTHHLVEQTDVPIIVLPDREETTQ